MAPRFVYRRLTSQEFNKALEEQGLPWQAFARIFGVNLNTVRKWVAGTEDVPRWVPTALTLLTLPNALGTARMAAAAFIEKDNRRPELGDFPYLKDRSLPADADQGDD